MPKCFWPVLLAWALAPLAVRVMSDLLSLVW